MGQALCGAFSPEHGETYSHLGVDLRLHHGPHHRSPTSSRVFHFHFKCLTALIQKLGRDRVVRMQVEHVNEPKQLSTPLAPPSEVMKTPLNPLTGLSHG